MNVSMRSMLVPGMTLLTAGAIALGPTLVAPSAPAPVQPEVPAVYIADIQLAGVGRDFYDSVTTVAQGVVKWASWGAGIIPFIGGAISDQIDINYFGLIQPLIANTVYAVSDIIANPLGILTTAGSYAGNQFYVGYSWVTSQMNFFLLPPLLGPLAAPAPLASTAGSSTRVAARIAGPRAAAAAVSAQSAVSAERSVPNRPVRAELRPAARTARAATPALGKSGAAASRSATHSPRAAAAKARISAKVVASTAG